MFVQRYLRGRAIFKDIGDCTRVLKTEKGKNEKKTISQNSINFDSA